MENIKQTRRKQQQEKLYYCYNPLKKKFLCNVMNLWYITEDIHLITQKKYWIFMKGSELDNALKEWRKYQEQRFNN